MKKQLFCLPIYILIFFSVSGCSEDNNPTSEPANHSNFEVSNTTDRLLRVEMDSGEITVEVVAGSEATLKNGVGGSYVAFTKPSETFSCVSVFDVATQTLVYQQAPIVDGSWEAVDGAVRVMLYRLVLSEADLTDSGVIDNCSP